MASSSRALSKLAVPHGAVLLRSPAATIAPRLLLQTSRRSIGLRPAFANTQALVSRQPRRGYASEATPAEPPKPKKPRFRKLRWTWRLGYLSAIAGIVYMGYGVYQDRHPEDQVEPDPTKKTLVVLGTASPSIDPLDPQPPCH